MALMIQLDSKHGLDQPLYWRLNNFEQFSNREPDGRRLPAVARFRGFLSEDAFRAGKHFLDERLVEFTPSSASADMASEAYEALKAADHTPDAALTVEALTEALEAAKRELAPLEAALAPAKAAVKKGLRGAAAKLAEAEDRANRVRGYLRGLTADLDDANDTYLRALAEREALRSSVPA